MSEYEEKKAVARANRAFYAAFEALDFEAMREAWTHSEEARCVHPGWELLSGREAVLESWRAIFSNTDAIRFDLIDFEIVVREPLAIVTGVENVTSTVEGTTFRSEAVYTNVFAREDGAWRMVVHHASPILNKVEGDDEDDSGQAAGDGADEDADA